MAECRNPFIDVYLEQIYTIPLAQYFAHLSDLSITSYGILLFWLMLSVTATGFCFSLTHANLCFDLTLRDYIYVVPTS